MLFMLDEFPALGRLDFFETTLAFMAGYGIKAFLIAQSLNQIEKAYGPNNAILDNCHVRVSFATNDERTAKRVSDALGTATEMRAMKNYAGHRLSPWLGHLMVSRSETARPLLTPGEIMQLPPSDEIVMAAGIHPVRAKKARYYEDARLNERLLPVPKTDASCQEPSPDDWSNLPLPLPIIIRADKKKPDEAAKPETAPPSPPAPLPEGDVGDEEEDGGDEDDNSGVRREPELDRHMDIAPEPIRGNEFEPDAPVLDPDSEKANLLLRNLRDVARQRDMDIGF
jgi:type IV secretion system protein VirD4